MSLNEYKLDIKYTYKIFCSYFKFPKMMKKQQLSLPGVLLHLGLSPVEKMSN